MMKEYEFIFSNNLKNKLIGEVKGGVKTWIVHDDLYISILMSKYDMQFEHVIPRISERILNGYTTDYAVYEIIKEYKDYLFKAVKETFFK